MKTVVDNPFIITGKYVSSEYFCDREVETAEIVSNIKNWRNSVLVSPRRMGKSGLISHAFSQEQIAGAFECFYIDIYATSSLDDFVLMLGKEITGRLQPKGSKFIERFFLTVSSIKGSISADPVTGTPSFELSLGNASAPSKTLEQLFAFLESSKRPCVVAIDEFQQIADYPDGAKTIAALRTLVQNCKQTRFIFAGSHRRMMDRLFNAPSQPFFMSCSPVSLEAIDKDKYRIFAKNHFQNAGKSLNDECFDAVYDRFEGHTWYVQYVLNRLYEMTREGQSVGMEMIGQALEHILGVFNVTFQNMLCRYSDRQRALLLAVAKEGKVSGILSAKFIGSHRLGSSSSVQAALNALLQDESIVRNANVYQVGNRFFSLWLAKR